MGEDEFTFVNACDLHISERSEIAWSCDCWTLSSNTSCYWHCIIWLPLGFSPGDWAVWGAKSHSY